MEQKSRARHDSFAEQFTFVLHEHWSDILQVAHRHSPRVATLFQAATPSGLKRVDGGWQIQVTAKRVTPREKLSQPRDNEVLAQAIRAWAHSTAQLKLPRITVNLEL